MRSAPMSRLGQPFIVVVAACAFLAACSAFERKDIAEYQIDAGSVKLSVISVAPWEEVVGELSPAFKLDSAGALAEVKKDNASFARTLNDVLRAKFGIAKERADLNTLTGGNGGGQQDDDEDDNPPPQDSEGSNAKPDPNSVANVIAEPIISYKAAASLFQEVKLLDNYLQHAVIPEGYRPYLVRLQLAVLPNRRNQPFDVFSDLQFLPGSELLDSSLRPGEKLANLSGSPKSTTDTVAGDRFRNALKDEFPKQTEKQINQIYDDLVASYAERIDSSTVDVDYKHYLERKFKSELTKSLENRENSIKDEIKEINKLVKELVTESEKEKLKRELENLDKEIEYIKIDLYHSKKEDKKKYSSDILKTAENSGGPGPFIRRLQDAKKLLQSAEVKHPTLADFAASIPKVVPLLVTDSLESAPEQQTEQLIRALNLLAAGTSGGSPFFGSIDRSIDRTEESLTRDLNSLLSISQLNDNAVRLRLGARYDAANDFEMTTRTHNITLLVNVPEAIASLDHPKDRRLRVLAINKMRDARTGELLEDGRRNSRELKKAYAELTKEYSLTDFVIEEGVEYCLGKDGDKSPRDPVASNKIMDKLLDRHVFYGDYRGFSEVASCMSGDDRDDPMSLRDQQTLWAALTALTPANPVDRVDIPLPKTTNPFYVDDPFKKFFITLGGNAADGGGAEAPFGQTPPTADQCPTNLSFADGVMTDDKKVTKVRLSMKRPIDPSRLELTLRVPYGDAHHNFAAEKIEMDGNVLKIHFPSLNAFRVNHGELDKEATLRVKINGLKGCVDIKVFLLTEAVEKKETYNIDVEPEKHVALDVEEDGKTAIATLALTWKTGEPRDIAILVENASIDRVVDTNDQEKAWTTRANWAFNSAATSPANVRIHLRNINSSKVKIKISPAGKNGTIDETKDPKVIEIDVKSETPSSEDPDKIPAPPKPDDPPTNPAKDTCGLIPSHVSDETLKGELASEDYVVVMRHADKQEGWAGTNHANHPLSSKGIEHAKLIGAALLSHDITMSDPKIPTSKTVRTCQTAQIIKKPDLDATSIDSMTEVGTACIDIQTYDENSADVVKNLDFSSNTPRPLLVSHKGKDEQGNGIYGVNDLFKELPLEMPDLACGEAALIFKEGDNFSCRYRILPHEWFKGTRIPSDQISENYWESSGCHTEKAIQARSAGTE